MVESEGDGPESPQPLSVEESEALFQKQIEQDDREFAKAKADGLATGKEPFDLDRMFAFYVMKSKPAEKHREAAIEDWEDDYYAGRGRRFITIQAYAEYLNEIDVWEGGDMRLG